VVFVRLMVPRPSAVREYILFANRRVKTPVHTLTSSRPPVIWPLPSAVKLPARVKKLLNPEQSSVPLIKKAY